MCVGVCIMNVYKYIGIRFKVLSLNSGVCKHYCLALLRGPQIIQPPC